METNKKCLDCIHVHICYLLKIVHENNHIVTNPPCGTMFLFGSYDLAKICNYYETRKGEL